MKYKFVNKKADIKKNDVLYIQHNNEWNDYDYYDAFNLYYNKKKLGQMKIIIPGSKDTFDSLEKENSEFNTGEINSNNNLKGYYSLADSETYKNLYREIDNNDIKQFLRNINDIAYNTELIEEIKDNDAYNKSLLRGINENYIRNILSLVAHHYTADKFSLKIEYKTKDYYSVSPEPYNFIFNPRDIISSNLHAIVGNNGVGKTRFLRDIALATTQHDNIIQSEFLKNYNIPNIKIKFNDYNDIKLNNVVYISLSPFDIISPTLRKYAENADNDKDKSNQVKDSFLFLGDYSKDWKTEIMTQIEKIFYSNRHIIKEIRKIISRNFSWDIKIHSFFDIDIKDYFDYLSNKQTMNKTNAQKDKEKANQLKYKFDALSSGQKNISIILIMVLANILENSLLIIDEPENYLHPPYISTLIKTLSDILQKINGAGIIATHSDVVLQGLPSKCVHILDEDKNFNSLKRFQTYGSSLDLINEKVFGLDMQKTGFYSKIRELVEQETTDISKLRSSIGNQANIYLSVLTEGVNDDNKRS